MTLFIELTRVAAGDRLDLPVRSVAVGQIHGYARHPAGGSIVFLAGDFWSVAETVEQLEALIQAEGLFGRAGP